MSERSSEQTDNGDEWATDDLRIVRTTVDSPVLLVRHFSDGSGPQTFSVSDDELDAVIDRLEALRE